MNQLMNDVCDDGTGRIAMGSSMAIPSNREVNVFEVHQRGSH